jgi:hypothetical protein
MQTFLGWLAVERFSVTPNPPAFTQGTLQVTNAGGPYTLPASFTVRDPTTGLQFSLVGGAQTVASGVSFVSIIAAQAGPAYNLGPGVITQLVTSAAGITVTNVAQAPATSWLIAYGANRESPSSVVTRCRANWARLSILQTSPADAYVAAYLNSAITGTTLIKKVAVFPHFDPTIPGHSENCVGVLLAGDAGPVDDATATQAQNAVTPYIGLHDKNIAKPCGTVTYAPTMACWCATAADAAAASINLPTQITALQTALTIGGKVYAYQLYKAAAAVPQIAEVEATLTDYTPLNTQLITLSTSNITFPVGTP